MSIVGNINIFFSHIICIIFFGKAEYVKIKWIVENDSKFNIFGSSCGIRKRNSSSYRLIFDNTKLVSLPVQPVNFIENSLKNRAHRYSCSQNFRLMAQLVLYNHFTNQLGEAPCIFMTFYLLPLKSSQYCRQRCNKNILCDIHSSKTFNHWKVGGCNKTGR